MARSRRSRSDVLHVRRTKMELGDLREALELVNRTHSRSFLADEVFRFLEVAEAKAFQVYARHGLPQIAGLYSVAPSGKASLAARGLRNGTNSVIDPNATMKGNYLWHYQLPDQLPETSDGDSDLRIAAEILENAFESRALLAAGKWSPERAFLMAFELMQDLHFLIVEYEMVDDLGPSRAQAEGRSRGGEARAAALKRTKSSKRARWLEIDEGIRKKRSDLSKRARASRIAKEVADTQFKASEHTIRAELPDTKETG